MEVINKNKVEKQVNIDHNHGDIIISKKTRFATRFERLNKEVASDSRYDGVMESLKLYLTKLDGVGLTTKLRDGGFTEREILKAKRRKQQYAKHLERNRFFESAQWIDSQLFAKILLNFETYVEPLINNGIDKSKILISIVENVINPVLDIINIEGESDKVLNYTLEDIYGMVYYLTGQCHINWKDYDNI